MKVILRFFGGIISIIASSIVIDAQNRYRYRRFRCFLQQLALIK